MSRFLSFAAICLTMLLAAPAMGQVWDETANGGGDAGDFPVGGFQVADTPNFYNQITGNLDPNDGDAYCIEIESSTWSADVIAGTETDTRLWLFDLAGNLLMFNDDSSQAGSGLQSHISDTASFPGADGLVNNPVDPNVGDLVIMVVNGFSDDALDTNGANLTASSTNFDGLHGIDPASNGVFGSWGYANGTGGTYDILLSGATLHAIPEPVSTGILALGLLGCTMIRRRK